MIFLDKVTQHSENNKMDLTNIAMVIAPSLFVALPVRNTLDDVTMAAKTSHVVRLLIKYHPLLWTVGLMYIYMYLLNAFNGRLVHVPLSIAICA